MKKILSIFALLLMTATGAWAQTETLLTTITATAKEQASYSTANVATVSFSYTAYGSSAYLANWGWWGYGWSATVNAAEGYTITKCIFYDDANRTATDSEAPFVVETTEEDKTPKVNGTPIKADQSKGIKKIEVYGYANPTTIAVTGVSLSQTEATMTVGGETLTLTATVAPDNATDQTVTWTTSDASVASVANGVVTAVGAGTATITATATNGTPDDTSDDFSATCAVTVAEPKNYSTSVNIEQLTLVNGVKYDITKDFIDSYIEYASINVLDTLNDLDNKAMRNEPYLGLKLKTAGAYIKVMVKKGSTLNVKLGAVKEALGVSIGGTAKEAIAATDEGTTYSYEATEADAEVVFTTASNKTVVFKQIMIDEPLAEVALPEPGAYLITVATPENGTAAVDWADKKYRTPVGAEVTVTATPAEGYELKAITVTGATSNQTYEVSADGKFTMPSEEVTVSATFKEESYVKLSDYAFDVNSEFIDDPDYGKEIEAKLTYKSELTGSYQNEFTLNATFNYEVVDKNGTVVTSGTQSPFSVSSNAVTIYIDGLEEGTEYTIRLTSAEVTDFDTTTFEEKVVFNQVTDLSGTPLASATFTTQQVTGIDGINADEAVKADGKYVENGKIVIYRNGAKYTMGGKKMK